MVAHATHNIATPDGMLVDILSSMAWMDNAACRGADSSLFFPGHDSTAPHDEKSEARGPGAYREARAICADCKVLDDCLHYALTTFVSHDDDHGMWGGTSPRERRAIKRTRRRNAAVASMLGSL